MAYGSSNNTSFEAQKWTNLRAFTISDATGNNTGISTDVDGTASVTLYLPSDIEANALTATTWETPRILTIGATGKSVDGSADISWSMDEIMGQSDSTCFYRGDKTWSSTLTGTLYLTNTTDAAGNAANSPALIIGTATGQHLEFDPDEIMAKATGTTTGTLYINNNGGVTHFGGQLEVQAEATDAVGAIHVIDTRTDANWHYPFLGTCANLVSNGNMYLCVGKSAATGDAGGLRYQWAATSSIDNLLGLHFSGVGTQLWCYADGSGGVVKEWTIGSRVTTTAPSALTSIDRIIITPYYRTDGPWFIKSEDDASNAYLSLYYNATKIVDIRNDTQVVFSGPINASRIGISNTSATTGYGISLYNGYSSGAPPYGIMFAGTETFGTHVNVTSDWATYFTMNDNTARGWIFRRGTTNVASIDGRGRLTLGYAMNADNPGIYWHPNVESASDASDAGSIYQIKAGVAGGTELRINQQNDAADCINLCTNSYIYFNSKKAFTINDAWLRINEDKGFSSGVYFGSSLVRTDNTLRAGSGSGSWTDITAGVVVARIDSGESRLEARNGTHRVYLYCNSNGTSGLYGVRTDGTAYSLLSFANNSSNGTFYGNCTGSSASCTGHAASDLALSGGTMTGDITMTSGKSIKRAGVSRSWINGRDTAIIRTTSYSGYDAILSMKTTNGAWELGVYTNNILYFVYTPDTQYNAGTNSSYNNSVNIRPTGIIYGACWNDYAEHRECDSLSPGTCVQEQNNGHLIKANKRLIAGASIISDTFGYAQGETEKAKTPIAVSGRVLAYTYRPREEYHAGMAVCSAPNGTIDIMTRDEIMMYPDAIVGIVSEIPNYEEWGTGKIKVNGRIWIKVR